MIITDCLVIWDGTIAVATRINKGKKIFLSKISEIISDHFVVMKL